MAKVELPKNAGAQNDSQKKKLEKVTTGKVMVTPQTDIQKIARNFLAEDLNTVARKLVMDYLLPMVKNGLYSLATSGLNMMLWGDGQPHGVNGNQNFAQPRVNYNGCSIPNQNPAPQNARNWQNILFASQWDANEVLSQMRDALATFQQVSVADYYDLCGISCDYTDYKYGWYNLQQAYVKTVPNGYTIVFPRPVPLSRY